MLNDPFAVPIERIKELDMKRAVDLLRDLIWAEADRNGIPKNHIHVSTAITTPDGGVDAEVTGTPATGQGIIKQGTTCYQVKSGGFSPTPANARDVLCKPPRKGAPLQLNDRVRACIGRNGTLVVVLTGYDDPDKTDDAVRRVFTSCLAANFPLDTKAKIEVWRASTLLGFLTPFLPLRFSLLGVHSPRCSTHDQWATESEMRLSFLPGPAQDLFIDTVRQGLRTKGHSTHLRVTGEPGIGKTRLVLEATREDDLRPTVLYFHSYTHLLDSDVLSALGTPEDARSACLVVDECPQPEAASLWNQLQDLSPNLRLITVHMEPERTSGPTIFVEPPPLDDLRVAGILGTYNVPEDERRRWVSFCSGSPRVAHVLGQNLSTNPDDLLLSPDTVQVWQRYTVGRDDPADRRVQIRQTVLQWISLFKHFGYGRQYASEAEQLASKLRQEADIPREDFHTAIADLRKRRILQGETTLYITPKLLHVWLWTEWWRTHGDSFDLNDFITVDADRDSRATLGTTLVDGFFEMFAYARASDLAMKTVNKLLEADGPFTSELLNSELGSRFFWRLAEASPPGAVRCLNRVLGSKNREELLSFGPGRRNVINALEGIAVWRHEFALAARLLLALAEAENETWANNATGVFAGLFSLGPGPAAPSEASPQERFPVLLEALDSRLPARTAVGILACQGALAARPFYRAIGREWQGLRAQPEYWRPATWADLFDAYRQVWTTLHAKLEHFPPEQRAAGTKALLDSARGLTHYGNLAEMVLGSLADLAASDPTARQRVLAEAVEVLHFDTGLPPATRELWQKLSDDLTGSDFGSLLRRYVGLDILADQFDETGEHREGTHPKIAELARQAAARHELLVPELPWLTSRDASNGYAFGEQLGELDQQSTLLPTLIDAQGRAGAEGSLFFLGGYLHTFRTRDEDAWEALMDSLAADLSTCNWVPELTWRGGPISDRAGLRVLDLVRRDLVPFEHLRVFAYGSSLSQISEKVFLRWLKHLLKASTPVSLSLALNLHNYYYRRASTGDPPPGITYSLLVHRVLRGVPDPFPTGTMDAYHWKEIASRFVERHPEKAIALASVMLNDIGNHGAITGGYASQTREVLNEITRRNPAEVWHIAASHLEGRDRTRAYYVQEWLRTADTFDRNSGGAISIIAPEVLFAWVDESPTRRAPTLARIVPVQSAPDGTGPAMWKGSLRRYGHIEHVQNELYANFMSHGWTGPASLHEQQLVAELRRAREGEIHPNVLQWIDDTIASLETSIEEFRAREERGR